MDGRDLARVDAKLGAEAVAARPREVGEQALLVVELWRDTATVRRPVMCELEREHAAACRGRGRSRRRDQVSA